jgi:hypothetical protein
MAQMDHTEALRLQAAEKYALKELSPSLMEEYEEHFFDCAECAVDIKTVTAFVDASRVVLPEQRAAGLVPDADPSGGGWFGWLKPVIAIPAFAALVLFVGYEATQHIRHSEQPAMVASIPQVPMISAEPTYETTFTLHGIARGGPRSAESEEKPDSVSVQSGQNFDLRFDFLPKTKFTNYVGRLQDAAGRIILQFPLSNAKENKEIHVPVTAGSVHSGQYDLTIAGDPSATGQFQPQHETLRCTFTVEILL